MVVGGPLPDVARHVVEPEAVGSEQSDRGRASPALCAGIPPRELPLPEVRHQLAVRPQLVSPRKSRAVEPAARRILPLGLGWQVLSRPPRERIGVLVGDVRDGMILALRVVARGTPRMAPAGA